MADLHAVTAGWEPGPVETAGSTSAWAVGAFSGLLDLDPVAAAGDELPPLWHWLGFGEHTRQDELGDDGHPLDGPFLPPVPQRRRMHAGGRLEVHAPMRVGEQLRCRSRLVRSEVKDGRSGQMLLVSVRHEFSRPGPGGELLVAEEQDFAYRSQEPGQGRGITVEPPDDDPPPPGPRAVALAAEETLLFRFSALTYNTHRIHYDEPYATGVEGYPGLVVHGPLMALLGLEIPRREHPGRRVAGVDYRLRRPAFVPSGRTTHLRIVADLAAADAARVDGSGPEGSDGPGLNDSRTDHSVSVVVGVPGSPPSLTAVITYDPPP